MKIKFSERLRELRKAKGLTQMDIAKYLGLSTDSTVSLWENESNPNKPGLDNAKRLALLFDVSLDYLLGEQDEKGKAVSDRVFAVTNEELDLLARYRGLTYMSQQTVLNLIQSLEQIDRANREQSASEVG
jgi:transcriptional regulator with XRE-family HTH domain